MRTTAQILAFLLLVSTTAAAIPAIDGIVSSSEYAESVSLHDGAVTVSWSFEGATAAFAISARTSGWVALGFGASQMMEGADMIVGYAPPGDRGTVLDCYSTGPTGPHPEDSSLGGQSDLPETAVTETGGVTVMELRRAIGSNEPTDKPVAAGDPFIWAIGPDDDPDAYHEAAGVGVLGDSQAGAAPRRGARLLVVLPHALPLSLSFLLMATGMLVARYGKKNRRWLSIHRPLGIAASVLGIVGLGFGIRMVAVGGGVHLRVLHTWVGVVALAAMAAAPLLGQTVFWAKKGKPAIRAAHRYTGRAAILLMASSIVLGLVQAGVVG